MDLKLCECVSVMERRIIYHSVLYPRNATVPFYSIIVSDVATAGNTFVKLETKCILG